MKEGTMGYIKIPYVNKEVSQIIFGASNPLLMSHGDGCSLLDAVLEAGINTIDLARVYQHAETSVGDWLEKRGCRDQVVLLSKCGHPDIFWRKRVSEKEMRKDLERSMKELRTDYIDIYLLHRDDTSIEAGIAVEIFNAMHAEGKIGAFGGSNWSYERIMEANEYAYKHGLIPFTVSSPHFGLAEQIDDPWGGGCVTITGEANREARNWYEENQMPVIAYSSLGNGFFSGRVKGGDMEGAKKTLSKEAWKGYGCAENLERLRRCEILAEKKGTNVPSVALRWMFGQQMNVFAVVTTVRPERLMENVRALELELSPEEMKYLNLEE